MPDRGDDRVDECPGVAIGIGLRGSLSSPGKFDLAVSSELSGSVAETEASRAPHRG